MESFPHGYSSSQVQRIQTWSNKHAKPLHLATSVRAFWYNFKNPLEIHRAAPLLEGVLSTLPRNAANPRRIFINALAAFCGGKPGPIEKLMASSPAQSRKRAA